MLDPNWFSERMIIFQNMETIVHLDEKWFDMTKEKNTYYLHPKETRPLRRLRNATKIGKVMFLTAVAKPRYGDGGVVTFDGKIGTWAFVTETPAKRKSKNRDKGAHKGHEELSLHQSDSCYTGPLARRR